MMEPSGTGRRGLPGDTLAVVHGRKNRQVFSIEKEIRRILLKKSIAYTDDLLFHVKTPHSVAGKLYRLCRDLGIFRRSVHKCRKTYISDLLNKGVDPDFVREQVGHKDLQTTLNSYVYSTTRNDEKIKQLNKISFYHVPPEKILMLVETTFKNPRA